MIRCDPRERASHGERNRRRHPTGEIQIRSSANIGRRAGNVGGASGFSRKCACSQRNGRPHKYHSLRSPMSIVGCGLSSSTAARSRFTCSRRSPGRNPRCVARTRNGSPRAGVDPHVERAARLVAVDGQIEVRDALERVARKHGVAEFGAASLEERARGDVIAGRVLELDEKVVVRALQRHFLQRDDVGVELGQHVDDARRRVAAVGCRPRRECSMWRRAALFAVAVGDPAIASAAGSAAMHRRRRVRVSLRRARASFRRSMTDERDEHCADGGEQRERAGARVPESPRPRDRRISTPP